MRCCLCLVLFLSHAAALEIGDPAPVLNGVSWIKDQPLKLGEKLTVLQFWNATSPTDTMAHLSELQRAHRDRLAVVGLTGDEVTVAQPVVDELGGKMDYHVGLADPDLRAKYLSKQDPLPWIVIVDAAGRLAWRGRPQEMDNVLDRMLAGTLDTDQLVRLAPLQLALNALLESQAANDEKSMNRALELTAFMLKVDPLNLQVIRTRLWLADTLERSDTHRATLAAIPLEKLGAKDASALAEDLLQEDNPAHRHPDLAYAFAKRAREAAPDKPGPLGTYARVLFLLGFIDEAIAAQDQAVRLDPTDDEQTATLGLYQQIKDLRAKVGAEVAAAKNAAPTVPAPKEAPKETPKAPAPAPTPPGPTP
jgi:tetratricopeptide (TPR) repeat protein